MYIFDCDVTEFIPEYDVPDDIHEWKWIENISSYKHSDNGSAGVWEFIVHIDREFDYIPPILRPIITNAVRQDCTYILFHQGT